MRIVCISDTHGKHNQLKLPSGDMIIHAGDISSRGYLHEVADFLNWFSSLNFKHKIFIAGNHDFYFEKAEKETIEGIIPENITYLNDSFKKIEGLKIWGSPIQPAFYNWAFNRERGADIKQHWDLIPNELDILITHGPPLNILDLTVRDRTAVGCKDLLENIQITKPKYHIFGHIHEAYGKEQHGETTFINASVLDERYLLKNAPIVFEI